MSRAGSGRVVKAMCPDDDGPGSDSHPGLGPEAAAEGSGAVESESAADARADAYRRGLGLLVRREQSRRELTRKLAQRGVDPEVAAAAVARLEGLGYQDDDRFAAAFARDRAAAGYGPVRIRGELAGHGLDADGIASALAACEADWAERAGQLVARRFRPAELADPVRRRKAVEFLLRRGFDAALAARAVDLRRAGEDDGDMST